MGGVVDAITGGKPEKSKAVLAAQKRQEDLLRQQEAEQRRDQIDADKREEDLSGKEATMRRAIAARRRGRGGLAFTGATGDLKQKLGGGE